MSAPLCGAIRGGRRQNGAGGHPESCCLKVLRTGTITVVGISVRRMESVSKRSCIAVLVKILRDKRCDKLKMV